MTEEQTIEVQQPDGALAELVTRAEYDVQIATAKKYPRSIKTFMNTALEMATLTEEVAQGCIYALPRKDKSGKMSNIEGPSARFAEMVLHAWGHCRAGARIVNEDSKFVTAQGVCHDLQSNTLIAFEVRRRITDKYGKRYNDDMIGVTSNAACSIALRNAVLKVIPKVFWSTIYDAARKTVVGDTKTLVNRRNDALSYLQKFGATQEMVLAKLDVKGVEDITLDHLVTLRGMATALKDGDSTVENMFSDAKEIDVSKPEESSILNNLKQQVAQEAAKPAETPETPHDTETGEITEEPLPDFSDSQVTLTETTKLIATLKELPEEERAGAFVAGNGMELVEALKKHGFGVRTKEFKELGIRL